MSAFAFLFQVAGTLDGVTVVPIPNPLPAPTNGVHTVVVPGNLGIIDPFDNTPFDTPGGYLIRAIHIECSAATRAFQGRAEIPGVTNPQDLFYAQTSPTAVPLQRLEQTPTLKYLPKGSRILIENDDMADFTGVPVAGPHRVYIEMEPCTDEEMILSYLEKEAADRSAFEGRVVELQSFQAVAATLVTQFLVPEDATRLERFQIANGAVAAAGESMTFNLQRIRAGAAVALVTGVFTIDSTDPANIVQAADNLLIRDLCRSLVSTDRIQLTRTYVAGGGPTPMTNTHVRLRMEP